MKKSKIKKRYQLLWVLLAACLMAIPAVQAQTVTKTVKVELGGLYELVVNQANGNVYVAAVGHRGENVAQIVILDGETLERKGSIDVSDNAVFGLGINQKTQTLYGAATGTGKVVVIDIATGEVVATIADSNKAHLREAIVDEKTNTIYISDLGSRGAKNEIWVIDGDTNTLDHKIVVDTKILTDIALDAKNDRAFGTGMGANEIAVIDLDSGKTIAHWPAGGEKPTNAVYDAESNRLFVTNQKSGTLTVLDGDDGSLIATVPTGAGALDVRYDAGANRLYVANRKDGTLTIIDDDSYEVVTEIKTGTYPQTVAINRQANRVYVSNKAKRLPRDAPKDAKPPKDPNGDTVILIKQ